MKKKAAERERKRLSTEGIDAEVVFHKDQWVLLVSPEWLPDDAMSRPRDGAPTVLYHVDDVDWLICESEYQNNMRPVLRKQRKALRLSERGVSQEQIAFELRIQPKTVREYCRKAVAQLSFEQAA